MTYEELSIDMMVRAWDTRTKGWFVCKIVGLFAKDRGAAPVMVRESRPLPELDKLTWHWPENLRHAEFAIPEKHGFATTKPPSST